MFERLKETLRDALSRASSPQGRAALAQMRDALVQAKVGLADLRDGVERTRTRLTAERAELDEGDPARVAGEVGDPAVRLSRAFRAVVERAGAGRDATRLLLRGRAAAAAA